MNKKTFVRVMLLGLAIFIPILAYCLYFLYPKMGAGAITTVLVSLFFTITCLVTLLGFLLRTRSSNNEVLFGAFRTSLRQGVLVGVYVLGILGLASTRLLTWWDALLLALSLILFEIYFNGAKERNV